MEKLILIFIQSKNLIQIPAGMCPIKYWNKSILALKQFQNEYYKSNVGNLNSLSVLKFDFEELSDKGNGVEKNQVLSLLAAIKILPK